MLGHRGNVKRLIPDTVAIAAAIENRDETKCTRAGGKARVPDDAQRAGILLDQMAVITTNRRARSVVSVGFCEVVRRAVHQPRHAGHDDLAHI